MTVLNASCLDPVVGLQSLDDRSIDVYITDPPYEAEAHTKGRRVKVASQSVIAAPLPFPPITTEDRARVAAEMARTVRRWVLVFCQIEGAPIWRSALEQCGLQYIRTAIWVKPDGQPQLTGDRPGMGYEAIVIAHPKGRKTWNGGGKTGVFSHSKSDGPGKSPHPTTKPQSLMRELVSLFSNPGETIADPFAGSGSTGVACKALGRGFVGWEVDSGYAEIANRRLSGISHRDPATQIALF